MRASRRAVLALLALGVLALALAACGAGHSGAAKAAEPGDRPNIVFVLTDDLAWNLVQYMPHVQELQRRGMTFSRYYVTDSLCCPSRSSIFSGRFPHNTRVFGNKPPDGGFQVFHDRGEENSTFATALHDAGYRTAMMGKYLNGYFPADQHIPPGWDEWDVGGNAYAEFNYNLLQNGQIVRYGAQPQDYLTDVVGGKAVDFINASADAGKPFIVELATFAPHAPYTPAPRNAGDFPGHRHPGAADRRRAGRASRVEDDEDRRERGSAADVQRAGGGRYTAQRRRAQPGLGAAQRQRGRHVAAFGARRAPRP